MTKHSKIAAYSDGGSRGNPGPGAIGVLLLDETGNIIISFCECVGKATNNQAEYLALTKALELAAKYRPEEVQCYSDSELVIRQVSGEYRVKDKKLQALYHNLKAEEKKFKKISYRNVPRENEFITIADELVNKALDESGC